MTEKAWLQALAWVMTQPGLIEGLPGGHEPLLEPGDPRLEALLERDSAGLMELLRGPRAHKLGIAFEALMLWGLEQGLGYRCIARDVQVQDGKRTMGALDFILEAPDGAHEHWELAYKLYLQCDDGLDWSSWLGPRGRDRLGAKVSRMLTHQLPLSQTPQAQSTLKPLGVDEVHRRRLMVQGVLFSPWGKGPRRATQGHRAAHGRWARPSQVQALAESRPQVSWVQRVRPFWFGPWCESASEVAPVTDLLQSCLDTPLETAQLWSCLDHNEGSEQMFFVVPEDWGT